MREVDLDKPSHLRRTILAYGGTRSGKTHFAATAPRPLFLSDATESGWTTIQNMDRDRWYEPSVKPRVWPIAGVADMAQAYSEAMLLVQNGTVRTIVIDSLTFYADLYLAMIFNVIAADAKKDNRKAYGELNIHLRDLRVKWHNLPCNIIWLCLCKEPDEEDKFGGPMIPGQQAMKFMAGCDNILFFRTAALGPKTDYYIHTKKYLSYPTGGREGSRVVVDPLPQQTFRSYLAAIGDPEQDVDAAVPPIEPIMPSVTPVRPAQQHPPVRPSVVRAAPTATRAPIRRA